MPRSSWLTPRLLLVSTTVALLAAVATFVVLDGASDDEPAASSEGTIALTPSEAPPADDPVFTTFEGDDIYLSSLQGRPLLVNFFASTCTPCITEMPALEEVFQEMGDEVSFLGLAIAEDRTDDALELVERTGVTYPTAQDDHGEVINALGATVLPTTVLLDAEGEVVTSHSGALDADELRDLLDSVTSDA